MSDSTTLKTMTRLFTALAVLAVAPQGYAQAFPSKPVHLVIPFLGGTDPLSRWLAFKLTPALGQQVIVDPRIGAAGKIGHTAVAKAPPDGHMLLIAAPPFVVNPFLYKDPGYDPIRDFTAITRLANIPTVLIVHPSIPVKSVAELVQLARNNPGKLAFPSSGVGSTSHLAGELFKSLTKTNLLHVPYKSGSAGIASAMTGEVDIALIAAPSVEPYVKSGRMRAFAVLDTKRVSSMPQVPTAAEAGIPQLLVENWYVLLAPANTPKSIVDTLNAELARVIVSADTRERYTAMGAEQVTSTPEQSAEYLRQEQARWGKVVKDAGIKME